MQIKFYELTFIYSCNQEGTSEVSLHVETEAGSTVVQIRHPDKPGGPPECGGR